MNSRILLTVVSLMFLQGTAQAGVDLSILDGDTGKVEAPAAKIRAGTTAEAMAKVDADMKVKCQANGMCEFFKSDSKSNNFRVRVNMGKGNDFGSNNGGGFAIYNGGSGGGDNYYGLTLEYVHSNAQCRQYFDESVVGYIKTWLQVQQTSNFVEKVLRAQDAGEDYIVPEPIKLAFTLLATIAPKQQNNCMGSDNGGSFNR